MRVSRVRTPRGLSVPPVPLRPSTDGARGRVPMAPPAPVHETRAMPPPTSLFPTVVVGDDDGPGGRDALALARALADPGATITPVTVQTSGPAVSETLHEAASAARADLLVIGACHRGPVGRVLAGDDTRRIVRDAPCPVAVAPHGYAEAGHELARIGVGYDGDREAEAALRLARAIADRGVQALDVKAVPLWPAEEALDPVRRERTLERTRAMLTTHGDMPGTTWTGIELPALAEEVDLLVVGAHRRNALLRLLDPSSAERLSRDLPCPLLAVPPLDAG